MHGLHAASSNLAVMPPAVLVTMDFDHTIVDVNSDTWIHRTLPHPHRLPDHIQGSYEEGHWTAFMNRVFEHLADQGVDEATMKEAMRQMPLSPGFQVGTASRSL